MPKTKIELEKPIWLKHTEEDVKSFVLKLSDKGLTAEKIGLVLRDNYGIPKVSLYGLKIKDILKERFEEPSTINLEKKFKKIVDHYQKNKQDKKAERSMIITGAKLKKRKDYHSM